MGIVTIALEQPGNAMIDVVDMLLHLPVPVSASAGVDEPGSNSLTALNRISKIESVGVALQRKFKVDHIQ